MPTSALKASARVRCWTTPGWTCSAASLALAYLKTASAAACAKSLTAAAPMPREPPVMSAALPAREIMNPPRTETRKPKLETRTTTALRLVSDDLTGARGRDEFFEEPLLKSILRRHQFRMPLDAHNPGRVACPLHCFDDFVRSQPRYTQIFTESANRLMMAAVDMYHWRSGELREHTPSGQNGVVVLIATFGSCGDIGSSMWDSMRPVG